MVIPDALVSLCSFPAVNFKGACTRGDRKTHMEVHLVRLVHTLAVDTPSPFCTAGAVCPREVFGLAHQQAAGGARAPEGRASAGRIKAVFGLLPERKLALPVGIIQGPGEI